MGYWYKISSTCGSKTLGSLIASSAGGAGSPLRVYNWIYKQKGVTPQEYFFKYLGGSTDSAGIINNYYNNGRQNYLL